MTDTATQAGGIQAVLFDSGGVLMRPVGGRLLEVGAQIPLPTPAELRRRGIRLAVVSDASPKLPHLHEGLGIRHYFEVYAISAVLGCEKPDPRMYHHAGEGLGLSPA